MNGRTVCCTHQCLGLAVLIPVISYNVGLVKLEVTQVGTTVYPPKFLTVQFVNLYHIILTVGATGRIASFCISTVPHLDDQFQLTVTVHISHTGIVGLKRTGERTMIRNYLQIALCPRSDSLALCLFLTSHYGTHCILARCTTTAISIVRHSEWLCVQFCAVAVDVVRNVIILLTEDAPRAKYAVVGLYGHQSTVEFVHCTLGKTTHCCQDEHEKYQVEFFHLLFRVLVISLTSNNIDTLICLQNYYKFMIIRKEKCDLTYVF